MQVGAISNYSFGNRYRDTNQRSENKAHNHVTQEKNNPEIEKLLPANNGNDTIPIKRGKLKNLLYAAYAAGLMTVAAPMMQSCEKDHVWNIEQITNVTVGGDTIACPCPGTKDTVYIEIPKDFEVPAVSDSIVDKLDSLGIDPEGNGKLLLGLFFKNRWEQNSPFDVVLNPKLTSPDEMVMDVVNTKINKDDEKYQIYGRYRFSLDNEGRVFWQTEEPRNPLEKPTKPGDYIIVDQMYVGQYKDGKIPLTRIDEEGNEVPDGYFLKQDGKSVGREFAGGGKTELYEVSALVSDKPKED